LSGTHFKPRRDAVDDEIRNKDDAKGRLKEAAGDLTGDDELQREGKVDKATGAVKDGLDKASDKVKDALGKDRD
jgi:uncharacterized protein YjbJ (UPF0337 family)